MTPAVTPLLSPGQRWRFDQADALDWLRGLADDAADLLLCSPPYQQARLYLEDGQNLGIARDAESWVAWMVEVVVESLRVCRGLCAFVVEGQTQDFRYSATPFLLLADLARRGVCPRKPLVYKRNGVAGAGGPDWLRNDWEPVLCFTRGGKLPWSNPTACGHPPKYPPGGNPTNRRRDGTRVNEPTISRRRSGTDKMETRVYSQPELANPGNVIDCGAVGGNGRMGDHLCHENEAPYPEMLCDFIIRTFCPPNGLTIDPFSGSGTTVAVAVATGRRAIGCDLRRSQVELATRRLLEVTPPLPGMEPGAGVVGVEDDVEDATEDHAP